MKIKIDQEFEYLEKGKGSTIVLLHGLMGGLENFEQLTEKLTKLNLKVIAPALPIFKNPIAKTNLKSLVKFLYKFLNYKKIKKAAFLGNSLGGHLALVFAKKYPEYISKMILTGSSGLYENTMGDSFPRRGDYEYIKNKTAEVFYNPKMATKKLVDKVYEIANKNELTIRLVLMAKSAIRHNMSQDLPKIKSPVCLIWGKQDTVTPPHVAEEFHSLIPNSSLFWIDKCGHAAMWEHPDKFATIIKKWMLKA